MFYRTDHCSIHFTVVIAPPLSFPYSLLFSLFPRSFTFFELQDNTVLQICVPLLAGNPGVSGSKTFKKLLHGVGWSIYCSWTAVYYVDRVYFVVTDGKTWTGSLESWNLQPFSTACDDDVTCYPFRLPVMLLGC